VYIWPGSDHAALCGHPASKVGVSLGNRAEHLPASTRSFDIADADLK
jgi:hypothetical protein